jgi:hypothetical protein
MAAVRALSSTAIFHYHNPVKRAARLPTLTRSGCRRCLAARTGEDGDIAKGDNQVEIAVRFVLPRERTSSAHDFSTKFGPDHICVELLKDAAARGFKPAHLSPRLQSREPRPCAPYRGGRPYRRECWHSHCQAERGGGFWRITR